MKVRFLKRYNRYDEGEVIEATEVQASNFFRRGVVEEVKEEKKKPANKAEKKKPTTK